MEFSDRLREYIKENDITTKELATEMGVPVGSLRVWAESSTIPAIKWQNTIEKFFDLSAKELGIERHCKKCGKVIMQEGHKLCPECANDNKRNWRRKAAKAAERKPYPPDKRCTHCKFWDKAISDKGGCLQILEKGHGMRQTDSEGNCMCYEDKSSGKRELKEMPFNRERIGRNDGYIIQPYEFERISTR